MAAGDLEESLEPGGRGVEAGQSVSPLAEDDRIGVDDGSAEVVVRHRLIPPPDHLGQLSELGPGLGVEDLFDGTEGRIEDDLQTLGSHERGESPPESDQGYGTGSLSSPTKAPVRSCSMNASHTQSPSGPWTSRPE